MIDTPTPEEIALLPVKEVSVDQFIKMVRRFIPDGDFETLRTQLEEEKPHGEYLGVHKLESGKSYRLHLKKIWIKEFTLKYSAHKNIKKGRELLISNFKLPAGAVTK